MTDSKSVVIHRGLCGQSLKRQCLVIGGCYILTSSISIILSSLMLFAPMRYVNLNTLSADTTQEGYLSKNGTYQENDESVDSTMDKIDKMTAVALHGVGATATEMLIESLASLVVSVLLIHGIRQDKVSYIFPWVIVEILLNVGNLIFFFTKVASPASLSVLKIVGGVLYFTIAAYFILSVHSYHQILRIRKKKAFSFLDHEFQGGEGAYYHTLEEEGGVNPGPDPVLPFTDLEVPGASSAAHHPFGRPKAGPFTEKAVPMTDEEDLAKENVLYAKM